MKANNNILLEVKKLRVSLAKKPKLLLNNISFKIKKNEIVGLIGESGSGKSLTSLSILNLLNKKQFEISGDILFENNDLLKLSQNEMLKTRGAKIAMIFQEPMSALNPTMKIGEQLFEMYVSHQNVPFQKITNRIKTLIQKVKLDGVDKLLEKYPHQISGGQKQRVMIVMALACGPKLLIADEPTTALDVTVQKEIVEILKSLQKTENLSILFISHDLKLVSKITDRLLIIKNGVILERGNNKSIFKAPESDYTKALLSVMINSKVRLKKLPTIKSFKSKLVQEKKSEREKRLKKIYSKKPILQINNLTKFYNTSNNLFVKNKGFKALDDIKISLYEGETLGLIGESGSGKTTLSNAILKINSYDDGNIIFKGEDISKLKGRKLLDFRKECQIIFQDPYASLNPIKNIKQTLTEPIKYHKIVSSTEKAIELLIDVGLDESFLNRYPHELSGGQRQRVCIARAISVGPKIVICDECVSALDVSVQATILNLLNSLKKKYSFTYIFISHDLSVVKYMSDKIVVLYNGKVVEYNDVDKIFSSPENNYTKKLINASV